MPSPQISPREGKRLSLPPSTAAHATPHFLRSDFGLNPPYTCWARGVASVTSPMLLVFLWNVEILRHFRGKLFCCRADDWLLRSGDRGSESAGWPVESNVSRWRLLRLWCEWLQRGLSRKHLWVLFHVGEDRHAARVIGIHEARIASERSLMEFRLDVIVDGRILKQVRGTCVNLLHGGIHLRGCLYGRAGCGE